MSDLPTTPPTVFETPETVLPRMPVTVLAAPVMPESLLLFMLPRWTNAAFLLFLLLLRS